MLLSYNILQCTSLEVNSPCLTYSSVKIPLEAWMSAYVYSALVLSCVGRGLAAGWSPVKRVLPTVQEIKETEVKRRYTDALTLHIFNNNQLYWAEHYSRYDQMLGHSKVSQQFMEP
jgi:hypothetical protein